MKSIDDLLTISISISFNGFEAQDGKEVAVAEYYEEAFRLGEDADMAEITLSELQECIEKGSVYGWMQQQMRNAMVAAGDLRGETPEESIERCKQDWLAPDMTQGNPS